MSEPYSHQKMLDLFRYCIREDATFPTLLDTERQRHIKERVEIFLLNEHHSEISNNKEASMENSKPMDTDSVMT